MAVALLACCTMASSAYGDGVIKIGDINSYSSAPQIAGPYRKGWQLAVEQINAAGGVGGRLVEVVSRDDAGQSATAAKQAQALIDKERVDVLAGTLFSNIGLAVSHVAAQNKKVFIAAEPLTDAITLDKGTRYTFRLRPSTYMQAAMLAEEAAKLPAKRWAMLAPNYEFGQSAVANFKLLLKAMRPDVQFVGEEWPALGKIDAAAVAEKLAKAKPDAIFSAVYGADLDKFVREAKRQRLLADKPVVCMLGGEPENLSVLKSEAAAGWIVTGYAPEQIRTAEHERFLSAYREKYGELPQTGSIFGYSMVMAIAEAVRKAHSTDSEKLVTALRGLHFDTPFGPAVFRAADQQATLGTYVGRLAWKDGRLAMSNIRYENGGKYMPGKAYVQSRRPAAATR